jgi:hypothetical protein
MVGSCGWKGHGESGAASCPARTSAGHGSPVRTFPLPTITSNGRYGEVNCWLHVAVDVADDGPCMRRCDRWLWLMNRTSSDQRVVDPFPLQGWIYSLRVQGTLAAAVYHPKMRPTYYEDTFGFADGPSEIALVFAGVERPFPFDEERRLLSLLYGRAKTHEISQQTTADLSSASAVEAERHSAMWG